MSQEILNLVLALTQSSLAVVATIIAVNQRREQRYDIRVENLKKMIKSIRMERYHYVQESLDYYRRRDQKDPDVVVDQVIFRKSWVQGRDDPDFIPLDRVAIRLEDGLDALWDSGQNPKPKFLPRPREAMRKTQSFTVTSI